MENEQKDIAIARQLGKSRLDRLFLMAMMGGLRHTLRKTGKHHVARALRAKSRIAKRKANR